MTSRMPSRLVLDRRQFLKTSAAGAALGITASSAAARYSPRRRASPSAFIYVGPKDDYGYNQAHAEGAAALKCDQGRHHHRGGERPGDRRRPEDRWSR